MDQQINQLIEQALAEDIGEGDITTLATVPPQLQANGTLTQKQPGVIFGLAVAEAVFKRLDPQLKMVRLVEEGVWLEGSPIATVSGNARALLSAERTALNLMQHLSGIATLTASCVAELSGTQTRLLDTRKTVPGLRRLAKAAVAAGGGVNHREGLFDAILIKDNHIVAAGGVEAALKQAKSSFPGKMIELECATLEQVEVAVRLGADRLLLDNMSLEQIKEAVKAVAGRAEIEVSGGLKPGGLAPYALPGVNYLSVGAVTHSAPALDISLNLQIQ